MVGAAPNMDTSYSVLLCDVAQAQAPNAEPTGKLAPAGLSPEHLRVVCQTLKQRGLNCEIVELAPHCPEFVEDANVLVVRGWSPETANAALTSIVDAPFDTFTYGHGQVKNAHTRHLVFAADTARAPNRDKGVHTVLPWSSLEAINSAREFISSALATEHLNAGCVLKYPDVNKCGISWHGDGERRITVLYRLGSVSARRPFHLMWFKQGEPISQPITISLAHGDFLISSTKAVGKDWKTRKIPTLRHSTGFLGHGPVPQTTRKKRKTREQ